MNDIDNSPMTTGKTAYGMHNPAVDQKSNPLSIAKSSIMELRYAVSVLGIEEGHRILDDLERLMENVRLKG